MAKKCVFLDRDGTINFAPPPGEYILSVAEFRLIPILIDWIKLFNALDYLVIVVTNQRCVARGMLALDELQRIHGHMQAELARVGAVLDDIFFCPHDNAECRCRKPMPGMIDAAVAKWGIDLGHSLMIGDSDVDRDLARACGLKFVRVWEGSIRSIEVGGSV